MLIIGDMAIDRYPEMNMRVLGGCAFNMAWQLCTDFDVHLFSPLSDGDESEMILDEVKKCKINFHGPRIKGSNPGQEIFIEENGEKNFSPFEHGVLKHLPDYTNSLDFSPYKVVMGPVHQETLPFFENYLRVKSENQKLFLDFTTLREFDYSPSSLMNVISHTSIMQFSPDDKHEHLCHELLNLQLVSDQVMLITMGAEGGYLKDCHETISFSAPESTKVIDTTGAGDAFFASFIREALLKKERNECLKVALKAAQEAVERIGSSPITLNIE